MKKFIIFFVVYGALHTYAIEPELHTLDAQEVSSHGALLRERIIVPISEQQLPRIWFIYGTSNDALHKKSIESIAVAGDYIHSQFIYDLKPKTQYFYQAVMNKDNHLYFGDIVSFTTLGINQTSYPTPASVDSQGNLTLEGMLQQYDAYENYDKRKKINTSTTFVNGETRENDKSFGFSNFWDWILGRKKKKKKESYSNLVHQKKEESFVDNQKEEKREKGKENVERNPRSAAEDDERGEIVKYNTNYKNNYTGKKVAKKTYSPASSGLNYSLLLLIVVILIIFLILSRIFYLKLRKKKRYPQGPIPQQQESKYFISVREDILQNSPQGKGFEAPIEQKVQKQTSRNTTGGTTFFRRPPKK